MTKLPHIRVERIGYQVFEDTSAFYARYRITDTINGATCEVRGPGTSGVTWLGDVMAMPWPNAATAFRYARQYAENPTQEAFTS